MDFLITLARIQETEKANPNTVIQFDEGDGIMDMMLKPTLTTYESKEDKKKDDDEEDND